MHPIKLIYDYFTPAFRAGGPTQSLANMVNGLNMGLSVIATDQDLDGTRLEVPVDQWVPLPPADSSRPASHYAWYCSEGNRDLRGLIHSEDTLFINSIFSHHFSYETLILGNAHRKIVSPRGMLDPGSLSQKKWKKQLYLTWWKLRGLDRCVEWHATTRQEAEHIRTVFGAKARVWVVPNLPRVLNLQKTAKTPGVLHMVSVAVISPMKNHLLVLQALNNVKENVLWDVYGPIKDPDYWKDCQLMMKKLPANISVRYHGDVPPSDVPYALESAHVAMLPSKSENFGHSIFEAFTAGKPVVTSHHTPWNGLMDRQAGMNVSINTAEELATAISLFARMDQETYDTWSLSARDFALASIDLGSIEAGYERMFSGNAV